LYRSLGNSTSKPYFSRVQHISMSPKVKQRYLGYQKYNRALMAEFWTDSDTIWAMKKQSDSDYDIKCTTVKFHDNSHNFQSHRWIRRKCYVESPDMFSYLRLKFQVNRSSGRHRNTGQQRLHEFCYLLPFDLWASYLARILSLQGSLMGCNIVSKCDKDS
jgi:hypothetical protein